MSAEAIEFATWEDSGFSLMARITGVDASLIQQADVASIAYSVFTLEYVDGVEVATAVSGGTGALTVATVVFDTLQTDARWKKDATGYNFRWDVPAALVATGNLKHKFEIAFTPSSGEVYHVVAEGYVRGLHRS